MDIRRSASATDSNGNMKALLYVGVGVLIGVVASITLRAFERDSFEVFKSSRKRSLDLLQERVIWPPDKTKIIPVIDLDRDWAKRSVRKGDYYFLIPSDHLKVRASSPIVWTENIHKSKIIGYDYITTEKKVRLAPVDEFVEMIFDVLSESGSRVGLAEHDGKQWNIKRWNVE